MKLSDFQFELPESLLAQRPANEQQARARAVSQGARGARRCGPRESQAREAGRGRAKEAIGSNWIKHPKF